MNPVLMWIFSNKSPYVEDGSGIYCGYPLSNVWKQLPLNIVSILLPGCMGVVLQFDGVYPALHDPADHPHHHGPEQDQLPAAGDPRHDGHHTLLPRLLVALRSRLHDQAKGVSAKVRFALEQSLIES